jgi:hypothetical protein
MKGPAKIAFSFVLEALEKLQPVARPMFGCHAIYTGDKLVLITRQREKWTQDNGVWIATKFEHHDSLRLELPSMRSVSFLGNGETQWQVIPADSDSFEEESLKACELVLRNDPRIGTIPKKKSAKKKTAKKTIRKR